MREDKQFDEDQTRSQRAYAPNQDLAIFLTNKYTYLYVEWLFYMVLIRVRWFLKRFCSWAEQRRVVK